MSFPPGTSQSSEFPADRSSEDPQLSDFQTDELSREVFRPRRSEPSPPQREGLPQGYRMRADAHYVDLLATRDSAPVLRSIATEELDIEAGPRVDIGPLLRSVRTYGILQPLLVRRQESRYRVIAGRSRLAVARALNLPAVPCFVHTVEDEAEIRALTAADNVRVSATGGQNVRPGAQIATPKPLGETLAAVRAASSLVGSTTDTITHRVGLDLLRLHSHRASWWFDASDLVASREHAHRDRSHSLIAAIAHTVEGFAPLYRLTGIRVQVAFPEGIPDFVIDGRAIAIGLTGAILALVPSVEHLSQTQIEVVPSGGRAGSLTLDVGQSSAAVTSTFAERVFDDTWTDRPGGATAMLGAFTAKAAAIRHGGDALWITEEHGGRFRLTIPPE